ncbi:hypothetical protein [Phaeocystidibacter luteus]|uniref:Uncharacterized protein n=1 Tax=Phaeocystidibacter luteus TaxID=911197 RepID=A0A6N6RIT5_9FLAO|nr:hypothetical protein [Phaeocystidibacter luteus]KAB2814250.1 hypothetical protein F8C67_00540 [Phaeocystidibacter luteus]
MKEESSLARHNAHWAALMGYDWMIETPSLIFNEMDDSETVSVMNDIEWLLKEDAGNQLHSFLYKNKVLSAYPVLKAAYFVVSRPLQRIFWNNNQIERSLLIDFPGLGEIRAFCNDCWENGDALTLDQEHKVGLSALMYRMYRDNASGFSLNSIDSKDDDYTSYEFSGAVLTNIAPAESFYHKGWFADLNFEGISDADQKIRIWIHKKNIDSPPQEGVKYSGELWLQCSFKSE